MYIVDFRFIILYRHVLLYYIYVYNCMIKAKGVEWAWSSRNVKTLSPIGGKLN